MNDNKYLVYSEVIIKSKVFDTEERAKEWFKLESTALKGRAFDVYEPTGDEPWDEPVISELPDGKWEAVVEANLEVYEDIEVEDTKTA